ncbi:hypothetical protein SM007_36910 [Streptomyces avermitilis]|uniref:Vegetative cell wall protein gp1 n=1 Tax=Streptomyces avermitilis TaxID=33903 RepID=A0A4D4MGB5_STRAX|nr:hypothetical protein [Streptomyces avermitilis]OOV18023.1 hypothetical protein SM007_36910 [Streptomyces avermitilis]GDY71030.1 hypothetical protein SAV31267_005150 [Streptomyces avermitilis]
MVTGILAEVGKHVSGRWLTAVLLPGLLLVTVTAVGFHLGHEQALDVGRLTAWVDETLRSWRDRPADAVVRVGLALLAAGVLGTLARELGGAIERVWLRGGTSSGGGRRRRALRAADRDGVSVVEAYLPQRPTWMSDRVRLVEVRARAQYWFDAAMAWPRLWLLVGDEVRQPVVAARTVFAEAVTLAGWGCLYAVAGVLWWPALIAGACVFLVGWRRARVSLDELATLIEAVVDVHHRALAEALGVPLGPEGVTEAEGRRIDDVLRKGGR